MEYYLAIKWSEVVKDAMKHADLGNVMLNKSQTQTHVFVALWRKCPKRPSQTFLEAQSEAV